MANSLSRRSALKKMTVASAAAAVAQFETELGRPIIKNNNFQHGVCKWCYRDFTVEELAIASKAMGLKGIDILGPEDWPALVKHGLVCSMSNGPGSISENINDPALHEELIPAYQARIREVADAGFPNLIVFSGNRNGMDDMVGMENCEKALEQIVPVAEEFGVTLCMELLNSKVNHADYMCDHTHWGVELCKRVGSDSFGLLYDIYHMQIMEGDIIRNIQDYHQYFAHYHTGGNPGRNEINDSQEIFYPAVMRAIVETGYTGFVSQEFIPQGPPLRSLGEAVAICDV